MTHMFDPAPLPTGTIVNVSRRLLLKGAVASGTLVLGASLRPGRAMADWATGAGAMPGGTVIDPHVYIPQGQQIDSVSLNEPVRDRECRTCT